MTVNLKGPGIMDRPGSPRVACEFVLAISRLAASIPKGPLPTVTYTPLRPPWLPLVAARHR